MERFESLSKHNEKEINDLKNKFIQDFNILKERILYNENIILGQRTTIENLHEQLLNFQISYFSSKDAEKLKKETESRLKEAISSYLRSFQEIEIEFRNLFNYFKCDFDKYKESTENKLQDIINSIERNFNITKIDREGVLKEIRVWEKTILIIEKKIENIYTLIERINKRGESCRKPE
jgi:hypothetical protein